MAEKKFFCPEKDCNFSSRKINKVKDHALEEHEIERLVSCVKCSGDLFLPQDLQTHHWHYHAFEKECVFCDQEFESHPELVAHVKDKHCELAGLNKSLRRWKTLPTLPLLERMEEMIEIPPHCIVLKRQQFIVVYDVEKMRPVFVFEDLNDEIIRKGKDVHRDGVYAADQEIPWYQVSSEYITNLDLENGHLAAARNHRNSRQAFKETFLMTNISPMEKRLNNGKWKSLESHVREIAMKWQSIRVITGPIYNDATNPTRKTMGGTDISIPTHFFKVVFMERPGEDARMQAFMIPNENYEQLASFFKHRTTIGEIESLGGLCFKVENERRMTWDRSPRITEMGSQRIQQQDVAIGNLGSLKPTQKANVNAPASSGTKRKAEDLDEDVWIID